MVQVCRGYIRVSTEEQAEEGYSLEAQDNSIRQFAQERGWELAGLYADEGLSAKDMKRPALKKLMSDLQRQEILLVWKLDRLSRSVRDTEEIFATLDKRSSHLVSVMEPQLSTTGASGVLVRQITAVFAEHYRRNLAENVRHGMTQLAKQGRFFGGSAPLGYTLTDGNLVPNEHADTVRRIYSMYIQGLGIRSICATLNGEGLRTPRGKEWSHHPVSHILQNPIYAGRIAYGLRESRTRKRPGGPLVVAEGEHEAIIDPASWQQVQDILARRKRLPSRQVAGDYPLTGIIRCGLCGAALRGLKRKRGRTAVKFWRREYWCYRRTNTGNCKLHALMANRLESAWLDAMQQWVHSDELREYLKVAANPKIDTVDKERELADIERRIVRWSAAYEAGVIELPEFQATVAPLREQKKRLQAELQLQATPQTYRTVEEWRQAVDDLRRVWEEAPPERRKELAHSTGLTVTVYPGYHIVLG